MKDKTSRGEACDRSSSTRCRFLSADSQLQPVGPLVALRRSCGSRRSSLLPSFSSCCLSPLAIRRGVVFLGGNHRPLPRNAHRNDINGRAKRQPTNDEVVWWWWIAAAGCMRRWLFVRLLVRTDGFGGVVGAKGGIGGE